MSKSVHIDTPHLTMEQLNKHLHISDKRKKEIEALAKFLFDNREKISNMKEEEASLFVTKNASK